MKKCATQCSVTILLGLGAMGLFLAAGCNGDEQHAGHAGHHGMTATPGDAAPTGASYANATCPIMGGRIDPARVTPELTREFKGQTVAFCCGGCPAKWDKLDAERKQALLTAHAAE